MVATLLLFIFKHILWYIILFIVCLNHPMVQTHNKQNCHMYKYYYLVIIITIIVVLSASILQVRVIKYQSLPNPNYFQGIRIRRTHRATVLPEVAGVHGGRTLLFGGRLMKGGAAQPGQSPISRGDGRRGRHRLRVTCSRRWRRRVF